jgi:hypothetical protein
MKGVPKDDCLIFFTQLMYNKINILADKPEELILMMKATEARLQHDDDSELAAMFSKLRTKNDKRNSTHPRKSHKVRCSSCESDGSSSEREKHRPTNWRHTQQWYRWYKVGQIA